MDNDAVGNIWCGVSSTDVMSGVISGSSVTDELAGIEDVGSTPVVSGTKLGDCDCKYGCHGHCE